MLENITFDHLKESKDYSNPLFENSPPLSGLEYLNTVKEMLSISISSLFITNYFSQSSVNTIYILRLNREKIELVELSPQVKNTISYLFDTEEISLDGKRMGSLYKKAFEKRLSQITSDLKKGKSTLLEEQL